MSKEELIKLLKEYKENKAKLNIRLKELKMYRSQLKGYDEIDISITPSYGQNSDIHSKNKISDKILNSVEKNETQKEELKEKISKLEETVRDLRGKVESVDDRLEGLKYKEKQLLIAYYIDGRSYDEIGNQLYFQLFNQTRNWETIKKIIEKATDKMINL